MYNSKLVQIIKVLKKSEKKHFKKYLLSVYHNKYPSCIPLGNYLLGLKELTEKSTERTKVFKQAFPKEEYDYQKLRNIMSYLLKNLENFLVEEAYAQEKLKRNIALNRIFIDRGFDKGVLQLNNEIEKQIKKAEKKQVADEDFLLQKFKFNLERINWESKNNRVADIDLQSFIDDVDLGYVGTKLKAACLILNQEEIYNESKQILEMDGIKKYVKSHSDKLRPFISIYYNIYLLLNEPENDAPFYAILKNLDDYDQQLQPLDLRTVYTLLVNYCIRRINKGKRDYIEQVFDLYKRGLLNKVLLSNEELSPYTYKNIVTVGLILEQFNWTETFIYTYSDWIISDHQKDFLNYSLAKLNFAKGDFDECIDILNDCEIADLHIKLDTRTLQIKAFYELGELSLIDSLLVNFAQILRRKSVLSDDDKAYHQRFIDFTRKLARLKRGSSSVTVDGLKDEIETSGATNSKKWFLEKIDAVAADFK